ncbi:gastrula zinc finger protein XlCGF57.1-like [Drosophila subpulchrella]|uniref:gastrula zinc finger protein XlCGF57.1-like n=1 Tax=Drosophila subpulchrella TaxID=1486046 RepID=UPI0018A1934A|nr:gastrula zinc finger protein XlCGF57.1-like [Drosophila subpulchrella]XP_037730613.1 gastrula zinc finger protein XlCGF57.1-like [Drosophila subpulchrella]
MRGHKDSPMSSDRTDKNIKIKKEEAFPVALFTCTLNRSHTHSHIQSSLQDSLLENEVDKASDCRSKVSIAKKTQRTGGQTVRQVKKGNLNCLEVSIKSHGDQGQVKNEPPEEVPTSFKEIDVPDSDLRDDGVDFYHRPATYNTITVKRIKRRTETISKEPCHQRNLRDHTKGQLFKCTICGLSFVRKSILKTHQRSHTGENPIKCSHCSRTFSLHSHLQRHLRTLRKQCQLNDNPLEEESLKFAQEILTLLNGNDHEGIEVMVDDLQVDGDYGADFHRRTGGQTVRQVKKEKLNYLEGNMESHGDQGEVRDDPPKEGVFDGEVLTSFKDNVHAQIDVPDNDLRDDDCGVDFYQEPATYKSKGKRVKKRHHCSYCPKHFSKKSSLQRHLGTHTGDHPFKCTYCVESFYYKSILETHLRFHTGEKPFKCTHCSKTFTQNSHLLRHMRSVRNKRLE